jgi:hypothetical protein
VFKAIPRRVKVAGVLTLVFALDLLVNRGFVGMRGEGASAGALAADLLRQSQQAAAGAAVVGHGTAGVARSPNGTDAEESRCGVCRAIWTRPRAPRSPAPWPLSCCPPSHHCAHVRARCVGVCVGVCPLRCPAGCRFFPARRAGVNPGKGPMAYDPWNPVPRDALPPVPQQPEQCVGGSHGRDAVACLCVRVGCAFYWGGGGGRKAGQSAGG